MIQFRQSCWDNGVITSTLQLNSERGTYVPNVAGFDPCECFVIRMITLSGHAPRCPVSLQNHSVEAHLPSCLILFSPATTAIRQFPRWHNRCRTTMSARGHAAAALSHNVASSIKTSCQPPLHSDKNFGDLKRLPGICRLTLLCNILHATLPSSSETLVWNRVTSHTDLIKLCCIQHTRNVRCKITCLHTNLHVGTGGCT